MKSRIASRTACRSPTCGGSAVELGYLSSIGTMTFEQLSQSKIPVVVPLKLKGFDHFVVYRGVANGRVYIGRSRPRQRAPDHSRVLRTVAEERHPRRH